MPIAFRWAVRVLLVLLFLFSLLVEGYFVPRLGLDVVHVFPEAWDLFVPALVWSILFIGCGQAILVVVWRLVSLVARERIFSSAAVPWVRALIVVAVIALVLLLLYALCAGRRIQPTTVADQSPSPLAARRSPLAPRLAPPGT